jgi:cellulose synthase/poly-beta-1,6-N-acetylglucosamine synthase-like glycosyltransferase
MRPTSARLWPTRRAVAECDDDTIVAFIDDDAVPSPTWLRDLASSWADAPASVACIGGPIRAQFLGVRPEWLSDGLLRSLSILDFGDSRLELQDGRRALFGANMSFRCALLRAVGGFDERLGAGTPMGVGEDDEAQRALIGRGWLVRYEPSPWVWHRIPTSRLTPREILRRRFRYGAFLGVRQMRPRRLAIRRCLASGSRVPGAFARRDPARAVEWTANLAENVGVLAVARRRGEDG